jgi:pyroglutamyl-peptidase
MSAIVIAVTRVPADLREALERAVADPGELLPRPDPAPRESVRLVAEPVILVTGFEPFGSFTMNPSQELVKSLDGRRIGNCAVAGAVLPVHHLEASRHVSLFLEEMAPVAVVHLGLADSRARLALERAALNIMDYRIPDNAGYRAEGEPCAPQGPAAYFASLPLPEILAALTAEGIPAYVSNTAGTYLCNQTLYRTLHEIAMRELTTRAGFIHLPLLPAMVALSKTDQASMDFPLMLRGVETALRIVAETVAP